MNSTYICSRCSKVIRPGFSVEWGGHDFGFHCGGPVCFSCLTPEEMTLRGEHPPPNRREETKERGASEDMLISLQAKVRAEKDKYLQKTYGITIFDYEDILRSQNYRCAICFTRRWGGSGNTPCVDHSHETELVRGLLCSACNSALGLFRDKTDVLRRAAEYLGWVHK